MRDKRHPSQMQLEAWFDGEGPEELGWHLAECRSCFEHVETLAHIRAALRKATADKLLPAPVPEPAGGGQEVGSSRRLSNSGLRVLAAVPVVVMVLAGVLIGISQVEFRGTLSSSAGSSGLSSGLAGVATRPGGGSVAGSGSDSSVGATSHATGLSWAAAGQRGRLPAAPTAPGFVPLGAVPGVPGPLMLAVIVPTEGTAAAEGTEIADAARKAVAEANDSGGVNGQPVHLDVVSAEDGAAVAALDGQVSAAVGGFDAGPPADVPWLLPADPWANGATIVSTELAPAEAGARLGQDLLRRGATGPIGVVVGTGPDTALGTGLAEEVPVDTVNAPSNGACVPALAALESQGVQAVAIAGSPQLAMSCSAAFASIAWSPPYGVLLAPSAAYAGVTSAGVIPGTSVYTVLGLPWPESQSPGATRFRSELPGVSSYRALVSFAAVEMAVQVARATHTLSMAAVADGTWQNDLYDFAGTNNVGAQVVQASPEGWVTAP